MSPCGGEISSSETRKSLFLRITTAEGSAKCSGLAAVGLLSPSLLWSQQNNLQTVVGRSPNECFDHTVSMMSCQGSRPWEQNQDCVALSPQTCMQIHFDPNILSLVFLVSSSSIINKLLDKNSARDLLGTVHVQMGRSC